MKQMEEVLKKQISLLEKQYRYAKTQDEAKVILTSLDNLISLYHSMKKDKTVKFHSVALSNPHYYQIYKKYYHEIMDKFYHNFIQYRDFHYDFICDVINKFSFFDYYFDNFADLKRHSKKELDSILLGFCQDEKESIYLTYKELKKNHHIIAFKKHEGVAASISSDYQNNSYFLVFDNSECNIESLVSLVHEISHIEDYYGLSSFKRISYINQSIYSEVHSLFREKEFYDYLLKHQIYLNEVKSEVLLEPENILEKLISLLVYCKMPLKNFNYGKRIKQKYLLEALKNIKSLDICDLYASSFEAYSFYDSLIYSYGELLSTYFLDHKDKYNAFRLRKEEFFSPDIFHELDITSTDIAKSLYKRYNKY